MERFEYDLIYFFFVDFYSILPSFKSSSLQVSSSSVFSNSDGESVFCRRGMKRISKSGVLQCVIKTSPLGFLLDQRYPIHGEQHIIHPEELGTISVLPHKIYELSWPL